jgi:hypothetical protein
LIPPGVVLVFGRGIAGDGGGGGDGKQDLEVEDDEGGACDGFGRGGGVAAFWRRSEILSL